MNAKNLFIAACVILSSVFATSCQKGSDDEDENYNGYQSLFDDSNAIGKGDQMVAGFYANETVLDFCEPYFLFEYDGKTDSISIDDSRVVKETFAVGMTKCDYYSVAKHIKAQKTKNGTVKITVKANPKANFDQLFKKNAEGKSNTIYYGLVTGNAKSYNATTRQLLARHGVARALKTKDTCTLETFHNYFDGMKRTKTID